MPPLTIEDRQGEARLVRRRVLAAGGLVVVMFAAILSRLFYLQVLRHEHYTTLSQENRLKLLPLPPDRGLIYSSDGALLAENRPVFRLEVVLERVGDLQGALARLRQIIDITEVDLERFRKRLSQKRRFDSVPLRFSLTEEEVARFALDHHRFPGFEVVASLARHYPHGGLLAHVVGYVGGIDESDLRRVEAANYAGSTHIGKSGIEQSYEELLHGRVGHEQVEVNSQGRVLRVLERTPAQPGAELHLTIDLALQTVASEALAGHRGALVALDPNTGAVLAMVSSPSFDPNPFVNGISSARYALLRDSPERPLYNRALQGLYPPGSTLKPFLALAGLDYGLRGPHDAEWCPGFFELPGDAHRYRCWKKGGHGTVALREAIAESCDVYFYALARDLRIDRMHDFLERFGFGHRTGVDLPAEGAGVNPSRRWKRRAQGEQWYPGETLIAGIGQGFHLATPLQLAHAVGIIATRGTAATPHLVERVEWPGERRTEVIGVRARKALALRKEASWDTLIEAMHQAVQGPTGTARRAGEGAVYRFAGKTGTSQLYGLKREEDGAEGELVEERLRDHGLFIAFAPLQAPAIAVAVVVENAGSGGASAAPIARQVLDHYLLKTMPQRGGRGHG